MINPSDEDIFLVSVSLIAFIPHNFLGHQILGGALRCHLCILVIPPKRADARLRPRGDYADLQRGPQHGLPSLPPPIPSPLRLGLEGALSRPGAGGAFHVVRRRRRIPSGEKPQKPRFLCNWDDVTAGWPRGRGGAGAPGEQARETLRAAPAQPCSSTAAPCGSPKACANTPSKDAEGTAPGAAGRGCRLGGRPSGCHVARLGVRERG